MVKHPLLIMVKHPLLTDPSYGQIIENNTRITNADYRRSCEELKPVSNALCELKRHLDTRFSQLTQAGLSAESTNDQAVLQPIAEIYDRLKENRAVDIEHLKSKLNTKKRSRSWFTLTIMGRTKAGKSTLFATLLDDDYQQIGTGQQRTTRKNKAYDFPNQIRLIDTPSIAAVGGETNEQEAMNAVSEADLICYVVTNDSIQLSEFEFLGHLKHQTKPLIILLNVQYNLKDPRRLPIFFKKSGSSGIPVVASRCSV